MCITLLVNVSISLKKFLAAGSDFYFIYCHVIVFFKLYSKFISSVILSILRILACCMKILPDLHNYGIIVPVMFVISYVFPL